MENIYNVSRELFSQEPQSPNSIHLELILQSDISMLFEILSILLIECLEMQLPNILRHSRNIDTFTIKLKQYFQSIGFDFTYEKLEEYNHEFKNKFIFQEKIYTIPKIRTEFLYHDHTYMYIPGLHNSDDLENFKLCFKVANDVYKLNFKFLTF